MLVFVCNHLHRCIYRVYACTSAGGADVHAEPRRGVPGAGRARALRGGVPVSGLGWGAPFYLTLPRTLQCTSFVGLFGRAWLAGLSGAVFSVFGCACAYV